MPRHQLTPEPGHIREAKRALRRDLLAARGALAEDALTVAAAGIAEVATALPEVAGAGVVAGYASLGSEPGTGVLLDRLHAAGTTVLLPVLLADDDLDWAVHTGEFTTGRRGLREPAGPRLGVGAIARADAVLVPGLAVSADGQRLGRGGGSYDRALVRVPAAAFTAVLLYDAELDRTVPAEPHDRAVAAAITPTGVRRFGTDLTQPG